ncbi:MAG: DUF493 domain-containing protein [Lentisphaeria bacterium]|nr:DUF493 domain-containing protein [Lentisphaeria bacterium]
MPDLNDYDAKDIKFPVDDTLRIVAFDLDHTESDLQKLLQTHEKETTIQKGETKGKYISYHISITYNNLEELEKITEDFNALDCVKFVL